MCADVVDQINVHEYPALADLRSGYLPHTRFVPQRDGMNAQQLGGSVQVKGFHGMASAMTWGRNSA